MKYILEADHCFRQQEFEVIEALSQEFPVKVLCEQTGTNWSSCYY